MTNISPATHKGLSEIILRNIEAFKKENENENTLIAFRTNLETLKLIYNEYTNKIKEVRELVSLYDQVQHCVKANLRTARNTRNEATPLIKTKILLSVNRNTGNVLEITEVGNSGNTLGFEKPNQTAAAGQ